jgi:pimeloyl-ACP methyl ester carboxylesterase
MDCYCISGLGADHRIFSRLEIPGVRLRHLPWLIPHANEVIEDYARRMRTGIEDENPTLLGVSFGGMMAIEIAKYYPAAAVVLVSSISHHRQLPFWMQMSGRLRINKWLPARSPKGLARVARTIRWLAPVEDYFLGVETAEDARLCREFRHNADPGYLDWAIDRILNWKNEWRPTVFYHLHGSRDRIFPVRRVKPAQVVTDGGHLMILNRAKELSGLLSGILSGAEAAARTGGASGAGGER